MYICKFSWFCRLLLDTWKLLIINESWSYRIVPDYYHQEFYNIMATTCKEIFDMERDGAWIVELA